MAAAAACPAHPVVAAPSGEPLSLVEEYLRRQMADTRAPGLAYGIVHRDRVVRSGAWGVDGDGRPVTARTPFVLGSVSKSFTALAVMQLIDARIVWHAGATANYFSHVVLIPGSELGVVVLSNVYSPAMDGALSAVAFNIAHILPGAAPLAGDADPPSPGSRVPC